MNKAELIELTKSDMIFEEIPLFEAEGHQPGDMTFEWNVVEEDDSYIVTMKAYSMGTYVTSKSRKVSLLMEGI